MDTKPSTGRGRAHRDRAAARALAPLAGALRLVAILLALSAASSLMAYGLQQDETPAAENASGAGTITEGEPAAAEDYPSEAGETTREPVIVDDIRTEGRTVASYRPSRREGRREPAEGHRLQDNNNPTGTSLFS